MLSLHVTSCKVFFLVALKDGTSSRYEYWRRSSRGHDHQLTQELDLVIGGPFPIIGIYVLHTTPTLAAVSRT